MSDNRLITSRSKKGWVRGRRAPRTGGFYVRYVGYVKYAGSTSEYDKDPERIASF